MDPRFRRCYRWGGCFGIRLVAGLAQISYKSKNFFQRGDNPSSIITFSLAAGGIDIGLYSLVGLVVGVAMAVNPFR